MTTASEVIDSYVADVAMLLPTRQRADIARELRGLLNEELEARADVELRPADELMARDVVASFGRPTDIAASYRTGGLVIIPPDRASRFVASAATGVVLQWCLGIAAAIGQVGEGISPEIAVQKWFFSWGLGAFWWPGFMVACAAFIAWRKAERQAATRDKEVRTMNNQTFKRIGAGITLPVALFFTVFYTSPDWFVGQIAPWMQLSWITYVPEFREARLWAMLAYMTGNVVLLALHAWQGFETATSRKFGIATSIAGVTALTWCALGGQALQGTEADQLFRFILLLLAGVELYSLWNRVSRERLMSR